MAYLQLKKQLKKLQKNPLPYVDFIIPVKDDFHFECLFKGPDGCPYEGGIFKIELNFQRTFPKRPPTVTFRTPIYHPNVSDVGYVTLPALGIAKWNRRFTLADIIDAVWNMLAHPEVEDPAFVNKTVAEVFMKEKGAYEWLARETTVMHATGLEG